MLFRSEIINLAAAELAGLSEAARGLDEQGNSLVDREVDTMCQNLLCVSARFNGISKGRRNPEFGLGLGDTGGYKLMVVPAAGQLQLLKGEEVIATIPYEWKSASWTHLKLQARKIAEGKYSIEGKVWEKEESKDWMIKFEEAEEPAKGRPSAWGSPYSSTRILVDDLLVTPAE